MVQDYSRLGGLGMMAVAILAPLYSILYALSSYGFIPIVPLAVLMFYVLIGVSVGLWLGFVFAGIGFLAYYKTFGLQWGQFGFLFPLLFGWAFLATETYYIIMIHFNALYLTLMLFLSWVLPSWLKSPDTAMQFYWILKFSFLGSISLIWSGIVFQVNRVEGKLRYAFEAAWLLLLAAILFLSLIFVILFLGYRVMIIPFVLGTLILCPGCILNRLILLNMQTNKLGSK